MKDIRAALQSDKSKEATERIKQTVKGLLNKNRLNILYVGEKDRGVLVKETLQVAFSEVPSVELGEPAIIKPGAKQHEAYVTAQT
ncbi:hypothetical protein [Carnobacterium jeotgali]|uniref:hypothetical protein n=1 Tax=Carnobacterium jeotgali TaxID=545534 RepID=UPI000A9B2B43|nr:hypothetical protein [Carnobacterium jeotgali]